MLLSCAPRTEPEGEFDELPPLFPLLRLPPPPLPPLLPLVTEPLMLPEVGALLEVSEESVPVTSDAQLPEAV